MFWVISVYFNIRNTLPKYGTFLLVHSVYHLFLCDILVTKVKLVASLKIAKRTVDLDALCSSVLSFMSSDWNVVLLFISVASVVGSRDATEDEFEFSSAFVHPCFRTTLLALYETR